MNRVNKSPVTKVVALAAVLLFLVVAQSYAKDKEDKEPPVKDRVAELETLVASLQTELAAHKASESAHHTKTTSFTELTDSATDGQIPNGITVNYAATCGDADTVDGKHAVDLDVAGLGDRVVDLEDLLEHVSRDGDDIYVTGANLHVVNGLDDTETTNGLGNIIIGYNEERTGTGAVNDRTGSHMLVVGSWLNYSSFGGIVVGINNTTSGDYASVSGGVGNTASGSWASVIGGFNNEASGRYSSVSGGFLNTASGGGGSVSGGSRSTSSGSYASVSGGFNNWASSYNASISGGYSHTASGDYSSVSGGQYNTASGQSASVSGGHGNEASGIYASVSGGSGRSLSTGGGYWLAGDLTAIP